MNDIPCKTTCPIDSSSIGSLNRTTSSPFSVDNVSDINRNALKGGSANMPNMPRTSPYTQPVRQTQTPSPVRSSQAVRQSTPIQSTLPVTSAAPPRKMQIPPLLHPVQKGQKVPLTQTPGVLDIRIGWNVTNPACDIDVSAFMLDEREKVIGDSWFVFYSQPDSPDKSVHFSQSSREDRQEMTVDLQKVDGRVKKIVFVLTIYEAAVKGLNFSMINDAYIRILDSGKKEIVSFKMTEYYQNVLSMMIGEVYNHKGAWKFNAVGNGISGGLEELCRLYGVELQ
ncbi:MAG: TerD family protein [Ruminococcus sp.]|nr:TerD family protein [Ruminococcus sp.]